MTQEEKYKEALLEARAVLEPCLKYSNGKVREALDSIDKELKSFESEDERIRKELIEAFKAYDITSSWNGFPVKSILVWLEKQKEQKQEWSEEDEEMLEYVIGDLNDVKQLFSAKDAKDLCDKEIAWLKSLRPQPSWKPSEEQMKALQNAVALTACDKELVRLYNQLKKL